MLEHIPGLPDLILFWMNDVSVIRVSRCGITHGTLSGKHVLTLIWMIMTGGSFKIVSNWVVLTKRRRCRRKTGPSEAAALAEWQARPQMARLPIERGRGQRKGAYPRRLPIRLPLLVPLSNACEGGPEEQQRHRQATPALRSSPRALTLCRAHLPAA